MPAAFRTASAPRCLRGHWTRITAALALWVATLASHTAFAGAPSCNVYSGQGYCDYTGKVSAAYVNSGNQILLYFDTPMDPSAPSSVGISGVSIYGAAIYVMSENMDFGKALYASLLSAQARGATVAVQMSGTYSGYMKIDRVWVYE